VGRALRGEVEVAEQLDQAAYVLAASLSHTVR
jgi:hypothetical protein